MCDGNRRKGRGFFLPSGTTFGKAAGQNGLTEVITPALALLVVLLQAEAQYKLPLT